MSLTLLFLGSGAGLPLPAPFCTCAACQAARADPALRRTRSSLAVLGREMTLIDAGPDFEAQLEREALRRVDNILISHWHYDHIAGLGALGDMPLLAGWPPVQVYLPAEAACHFEQELAYTQPNVVLHPLRPGDTLSLADARIEAVKTAHTADSLGYIFEHGARWAYLSDGVTPPAATLARLINLDLVILEATVDELDLPHFSNQSVEQAATLWQRLGAPRCILSHLSGHRFLGGELLAGWSPAERAAYARAHPGLTFANDGLRVTL